MAENEKSPIVFRAAWQKADPRLEHDAVDYWRGSGIRLPKGVDPDERARQLCAVAFLQERPVGVSTATLELVPQFRCRMALYRCSVKLGLRHQPLSWRITEFSQGVLEQWSLENSHEKVMGLMAVMQSRELIMRYPQVFGVANMVFAGFTPAGFPIRVYWFKHATIPTEWPPRANRLEPTVRASWGEQLSVTPPER
jgi:hypothetical protein